MSNSVFDTRARPSHMDQPMFFGDSVNVARYDTMKYPEFDRYTEQQLDQFWRPHEVKLGPDKSHFMEFARHEEHIFTANLQYQSTMDSVQGRAPAAILNPITSLPEVETWNTNWTWDETIHARSYTSMIRGIYRNSSILFDKMLITPEILARAESVSRYYDRLHTFNIAREGNHPGYNLEDHKRALILCLYSINALEAIRFYASFSCTFLFHKNGGRMPGSAKIMRFIARDEALHHSVTNTIIGILRDGDEGDEWARRVEACQPEAIQIYSEAIQQEFDWFDYLFQYGSMLGMNAEIGKSYIRYMGNSRMASVGLPTLFPPIKNDPLPWMAEYLSSEGVQGTPQEAEQSQYLVGAINPDVDQTFLDDLEM